MKALLSTWFLTVVLLLLASSLAGSEGIPYLVTTAGLPHFIVAAVFALISARHGRPQRRQIMAALAVVSVLACALYARFPLMDVMGAYFVIHMFRDEVYMHLSRQARFQAAAVAAASDHHPAPPGTGAAADPPPDASGLRRIWLSGRIFMVVAVAAYIMGRLSLMNRRPEPEGFLVDGALRLTGSVPLDLALGTMVVLLLLSLALIPRRGFVFLNLPEEVRGFLGLFITIAFVSQLPQAALFLASYHYISWYLFYGDKLAIRKASRQPAREVTGSPVGVRSQLSHRPPQASFWSTVMGRPGPFAAFMVAVNLISAAGCALYLLHPVSFWPLSYGYELAYFPYWTIPHVTLSFMPRR